MLYFFQIALWFISWWKPVRVVIILSKIFFAGKTDKYWSSTVAYLDDE